jgi:hypothetical protein
MIKDDNVIRDRSMLDNIIINQLRTVRNLRLAKSMQVELRPYSNL